MTDELRIAPIDSVPLRVVNDEGRELLRLDRGGKLTLAEADADEAARRLVDCVKYWCVKVGPPFTRPSTPPAVECIACDDRPAPENNPCVVCGKETSTPPAVSDDLVDEIAARLFSHRHPQGEWGKATDTQYDLFRLEARAIIPIIHRREQQAAERALQAIADLPTGRTEEVMEGQEQAYRAVEALFDTPPHIVCNRPTQEDAAQGEHQAKGVGR